MKKSALFAPLFTATLLSAVAMSTVYAADPQPAADSAPAAATAAAQAAPDDAVATKVKAALADFKQVNVGATNGVVTLSGTVSSAEQATQVIQLASSVEGVKEIKNAVSVAK